MEGKKRIEIRSSQDKKRKELCEKIRTTGRNDADGIFNYLEDEGYIEIVSPSYEEGNLEWTVLKSDRKGGFNGSSFRLGNVCLNMKKALLINSTIIINGTVNSAAFCINPNPIAGLTAISSLLAVAGLTRYDLCDKAATALAIAFEKKDSPQCNTEQIRILTNQYLKNHDIEEISKTDFSTVLRELESCHCISIVDDKIKIEDKIIIEYK